MKNKIFKEVVITEDMLSSTDTTIGELLDKAVFEARIEEMEKVIRPILEERVDIGFIPDLAKPIAEELVKQGYHKILPGFIVVDKEYLKKELQWLERQACKATAKKFAKDIFNNITTPEVWNELRTLWLNIGGGKKTNLPIWNLLIEPVAKQFYVEVEE